MSWRKTTSTRQGTTTMYGAADFNAVMDLLNGVNTGQPVNINNAWNFTSAPTGNLVADGSITSAKIANGAVVDADVSATAAIAKSKLAALNIVNADINSAAAIAKSKLAALGIVDADVSSISFAKIGTNLSLDETGLTADRIMTWPDIAGKVVLEASTAALLNKTFNASGTGNHLTDTSAAVGDILAVPSGSDFKRMGMGAARQVLRVKKDTSGLEYSDPATLPSSGRIFGIRGGWNGTQGLATGTGILGSVVLGNGTGANNAVGVGATDGNFGQCATGTSNVFARAGWWLNGSTLRKFNPKITYRFRASSVFTSGQGILYIGFVNQTTQPAAGTSVLSTFLDGKIGVLFGYRAADTHWMIMSNNAQATATYTDTGFGTPDNANTHTLDITLDDATPAIKWSWDGVAQANITDTTNNVPPSTTLVSPIFILEAQTATNVTLYEHWTQLSMDWV